MALWRVKRARSRTLTARGLIVALMCPLTIISPLPPAVFAQTGIEVGIVFPLIAPKLTSSFGSRRHPISRRFRHHNGVDLAAPENAHVRAILPGRIVFADSHGGFGKLVTIDHGNGYASLYGHLSVVKVTLGQKVSGGEVVGLVGESGWATGPHLHFEWRRDGRPIDPLDVFPFLLEDPEG